MVTLEMGKVQNKGAAMPLPSKSFFSTNESFHMRYLMIFFHKGHQSNQISKLQVHSYQVPMFGFLNLILLVFLMPLEGKFNTITSY